MRFSYLLILAVCVLFNACNESTAPQDEVPISTDIKDYLIAGNPGTELVYIETITKKFQDSIQVTYKDTITFTVVARDVMHPIGGASVQILESRVGESNLAKSSYTSYYCLYNNSIASFGSLTDQYPDYLLKDPLIKGKDWYANSDTVRIVSVGKVIQTPYKQLPTIETNSIINLGGYGYVNMTFFYAPEIMFVKRDGLGYSLYAENKVVETHGVTELVSYNRK